MSVKLKKNKNLNRVWHPETGFLFVSEKELVVDGKYVNDTVVPLDESDYEKCRELNFLFEIKECNKEETPVTEETPQNKDKVELVRVENQFQNIINLVKTLEDHSNCKDSKIKELEETISSLSSENETYKTKLAKYKKILESLNE